MKIKSDTVDYFPHHFYISKNSSADAAAIVESQLIHAPENPRFASPLKVEEPSISAIKTRKFPICSTTTRNPTVTAR